MSSLVDSVKICFADAVCMYLKAANFHWNVEGPDFYQYHKLFEDIYKDVYESVDPLAEHIRALQSYTPASLKRIGEMSAIKDCLTPLSAAAMLAELSRDNQTVLSSLTAALNTATSERKHGLVNFLSARIEQHNKWAWFLRSSTGGSK